MNLSQFDDDELDQLRVQVLTEQERRANLAAIPAQIAELAGKFRDGGGTQDDLDEAIK